MGGERALRERLTRTEILVGFQASQSCWACTPSTALDPLWNNIPPGRQLLPFHHRLRSEGSQERRNNQTLFPSNLGNFTIL